MFWHVKKGDAFNPKYFKDPELFTYEIFSSFYLISIFFFNHHPNPPYPHPSTQTFLLIIVKLNSN